MEKKKRAWISIEDCQSYAISRGGKCFSDAYKNPKTKMKWKCANPEHPEWEATFGHMRKVGVWCPYCANNIRLNIEVCHKTAMEKDGWCLSTEYENIENPLIWKCHIPAHLPWTNSLNSVKNFNRWCPECKNKRRISIETCKKYAESRNGECLSTTYVNSKVLMEWKCEKGHTFKKIFNDIEEWCQKCNNRARITIQDCIDLALSNNGECLSTYYHYDLKLLWECENGHTWDAKFYNLRNKDSWCPYCPAVVSRPHKYIVDYLKSISPTLKIEVNNKRAIKPMELDIYIPELCLAIEYDGEYWHYSQWAIANGMLERMERKNQKCIEAGIELVRIREKEFKANKEQILNMIIEKIDALINGNVSIAA